MLVPLKAVLWRRVKQATLDTLLDQSSGQYHITLARPEGIDEFFAGLRQEDPTPLGGYTLRVPIAPMHGPNPVGEEELEVRYMGPRSSRGDWNIPSQRSNTAYPLWRPGRAFPRSKPPALNEDTLILARDTAGGFHARWIKADKLPAVPDPLRTLIERQEVGIWLQDNPTGATMIETSKLAEDILAKLRFHHNVLLQGPPGTGKSHVMHEVARLFASDLITIDPSSEEEPFRGEELDVAIRWVTFHQAFGYEDFVVGLRPDPTSDKLLSLKPVPGALLELTEHARRPGCASLLLIDEVNRGNVSRILGELITLLEVDKRLGENGKRTDRTVALRLPYATTEESISLRLDDGEEVNVPSPFTMPRELFVLASMNSADKSVAPLDTALRRRFQVINLAPDSQRIAEELGVAPWGTPINLPNPLQNANDVRRLAIALLESLNAGISHFLGPDLQFGHWYLVSLASKELDLDQAIDNLCELWDALLLPQLQELFQGRNEQLAAVLWQGNSPCSGDPVALEDAPAFLADLGATSLVTERVTSREGRLEFFRRLVGNKVDTPSPEADELDPGGNG